MLFKVIHLADIFWLILLVVLVVIAVRFSSPGVVLAHQGNLTVRYTIELGERRDMGGTQLIPSAGFHENIRVGEPLFDAMQGRHIGTIVDVFAKPFQVQAFDEAYGVIRWADVDGLEYVYIVVEADVSRNDYETLIGTFPIGVGRSAYVRAKSFAGAGYIIAIEER